MCYAHSFRYVVSVIPKGDFIVAAFTKEGLEKLQAELEDLQSVQRPEVVREIEIAKGFGDLSENAEYTAARERQSRIEGRIQELISLIEHA